MKKNYFNKVVFTGVIISVMMMLASCMQQRHDHQADHSVDSTVSQTVSVINNSMMSGVSTIMPESGMKIFTVELQGVIAYDKRSSRSISARVAGRIERLYIRYNFQPVKRGQLLMEIYSPELAAAQRELIYVARSGDAQAIINGAKQRLQLLGMHINEINRVMISGDIMYRVPVYSNIDGYVSESGVTATEQTATPLMLKEGQYVSTGQPLFTIYGSHNVVGEFAIQPGMAASVTAGKQVLLYPQNNKEEMQQVKIGLVESVYRAGQNFNMARIYLHDKKWRVGQLVTASIPVVFKRGMWLPKSAVLKTGSRSIVYRKMDDGFVPAEISVAEEINDLVRVDSTITNWEVAASASYLADGESFIQPKNN